MENRLPMRFNWIKSNQEYSLWKQLQHSSHLRMNRLHFGSSVHHFDHTFMYGIVKYSRLYFLITANIPFRFDWMLILFSKNVRGNQRGLKSKSTHIYSKSRLFECSGILITLGIITKHIRILHCHRFSDCHKLSKGTPRMTSFQKQLQRVLIQVKETELELKK